MADENAPDISDQPAQSPQVRTRAARDLLAPYGFPFLLTIALLLACYAAAGNTLGLFLGGIVIAMIVTPGVILSEETFFRRAVAWAAVVDAILLVWLAPVLSSAISFGDWLEATLLLVACALAIAGVASALQWLRIPPILAAAATVLVALAWLSWPVWMAPGLTGENREATVASLVWGHPLFALNGAMLEVFPLPWAQMTIAYRLTNLGDDIAYEMPRTVIPAIIVHATVAAATLIPPLALRRRKILRAPATAPPPHAHRSPVDPPAG